MQNKESEEIVSKIMSNCIENLSMSDATKNSEKKKEQKSQKKGASLVEYVLLCMFIMVVAVISVKALGTKVSGKFSALDSAW